MSKKEDLKYRKKYNKNKDSTINDVITGAKHGTISGWNMFNIMGRDILAKSDRDLLAIEREERFDKKPDQERIKKLEEYINQKEIEMQPYIQSELANRKSYEEFYNNINNAPSKALTTLAYGGASTLTNPIELAKNIALGKLTIGGVAANFALGTALDTLDNLYANSYEDELLGIESTINGRVVLDALGGAVAGNSINLAVDLTKGLGKKVLNPSDYLIGRTSTNSIIKDMVEDVKENSYGSIDIHGGNIFKKDALTPEILDIPPLDLALKNDSMLKQEAKIDLKNKGYDVSVNVNALEQVAKRQEYGEPQFEYKKVTEDSIDNYLESISKLSKKIQSETQDNLKSNINLKDEASVALKPLMTNMELNIDQIRARRAQEMFGVRSEKFGNELFYRTENIDPTDFISQIKEEGNIIGQYGDSFLPNYMKKVVDDYARTEKGYSNASHSKKSFILNMSYDKNLVMRDIRDAYEKNKDIDYIINNLAPYVGESVELTKEEAEAVGLYFHSDKINRTIRKDAGGYEDFKKEFDNLKKDLKEKAKIEKKEQKDKIKDSIKILKEEYNKKVQEIRNGKENIKTEKYSSNDAKKEFIKNREIILEEQHNKTVERKKIIKEKYNKQIKEVFSEKELKIKEIKNKINELKKQQTKDVNAIQNNNKLYDPDKLPSAKRVIKEKTQEINGLNKELEKISSNYDQKISEIKTKLKNEIDILNKNEEKLKKYFSKETLKYSKDSKEKMESFERKIRRNINKELKKLREEFNKKAKKTVKENQKVPYMNAYKRAEKIGKRNYKKFYENFKELEKDLPIIKEIKELVKDNGRLVETNTYSIYDEPVKVAKALYYDINSTTREAQKGKGVIKYNTPYSIGMKWGNKVKDSSDDLDIKFENFSKIFEGREKKVYEIVSTALNELTKRESGFEKLEEFAGNIRIDDRNFSRNTTKSQKFKMQALDGETRKYVETQISALKDKLGLGNTFKPDLWIDPKDQRLNLSMAKTTVKGFLSAKFLASLNGIKEFTTNNLRIVFGARQLGWNKKYSILKSSFIDPFKVHLDLVRNSINIYNDTIDKITDPIVKRRADLFIERRVANDPVWNNPKNVPTFFKVAQTIQKGIKKIGDNLAVEQLISDVHRVVNSEWATINYLKDIFPDIKDINSIPLLKKVLETNGITDKKLLDLQTRLKNISDVELMELVWNGKRTDNMIDYQIQSLFEQFADIMGKEFNAFERIEGNKFTNNLPFTMDMLMLYKRYSLGAVDNFASKLLTYYDDDGFIRNRFDSSADFKTNLKNTFKGWNTSNFLDFSKAAIGTSLIATAISWIHGSISGSTEDERAEAKLKAIFGDGDILSFITDALGDYAMDMTGIGLFYGGNSVLGGFKDNAIARWKRAMSSDKITTTEAINWWILATFFTPEFISRGIDNIKFQKNIPSRLTTSSKEMQKEWKYRYKRLAEIDQARGKFPIEKVFGGAVNFLEYFKKHEDIAYEITGSDKSMDKDAVIAGAYGITKLAEEFSEAASLQSILSDEKIEYKQQQLKMLGLDVNSQLSKLNKAEKNTLNIILAFKGIKNENEILLLLQQLNTSDNKVEFLKSILEPEEMEAFSIYKQNLKDNIKFINKELKKIIKKSSKDSTENYVNYLDNLNNLIMGKKIRENNNIELEKNKINAVNKFLLEMEKQNSVIKDTENVIEQPKNDNKELLNKINSQIESPKFKEEVLNYISTDEHQAVKKVLDKVMNKTGVVPEKQLASFIKDIPELKRKEIKEKVYQILESPYLNEEPIIIASEKDNIEFKPFNIEEQENSSVENKEKNDARAIVADIAKKRYTQGSTEQGIVPLEVVEELTNTDELPKPVKWFIKELKEVNPKTGDKRVKEYHDKVVPKQKLSARDNWCATSLLSAFIDSGYKLKHRTASAQEVYLNRKEKVSLENAEAGNVLVFRNRDKNGKRTWTGHVSIIAYKDDDYVIAVGGNQSATNSNERDGENYISFKVYTTDDFKKKMKRSDLSIIAL